MTRFPIPGTRRLHALQYECLEPRLALTALPFLNGSEPIGLTTDGGSNIYVNYLDADFVGLDGTPVQGFNTLAQQTMAPVYTETGLASAPGYLTTLRSGTELGLQVGDLLNLLPDGKIVAVRPSTGGAALLVDLHTLQVDTSSIYDMQVGLAHNFGGTILPGLANYGDIAVFEAPDHTDLLVSGRFAHQFIMRVRVADQQVTQAKVLVSSTASGQRGEGLPPGVAVTKAGTVLTTLGFGPINASLGIALPVGFAENFDEVGTTPFIPGQLSLPPGLSDLAAAGITTDSDDNFVVAQRHGNGDLVILKQSFSQSFALNLTNSVDLTVNDVALLSDDSTAYVSVGNQVWQVAYPTVPNDAPVVTLRSSAPNFVEGGAPIPLDPQGLVADFDSSFSGGSLSIAITQNASSDDRLVLLTDSQVTRAGDTVRIDGVDVATISGGAGATLRRYPFSAGER